MEFEERIVVVTGGTRGIGRAVSLAFARNGARVFAAYLNNDAAAQALVEESAGLPGSIEAVRADVSTDDGAARIIDSASRESGYIDVLVNNAGIVKDNLLLMMDEDDWDSVIRNNLYALFHCCKRGVRNMVARRKGAIITLSAVSGLTGVAGQTNYAASKGAAISFTKSLARELGPLGIRVNTVVPGLINTGMAATLTDDMAESIVKRSSLGRIGTPEEVAEAVLFLASERASYITGQSLIIDGGIV